MSTSPNIVERLRASHAQLTKPHEPSIYSDAADEIEWLRNALDFKQAGERG